MKSPEGWDEVRSAGSLSSEVDMDRLLNDDQSFFNPLGRPSPIDFRLVDARDGYAQISVVLPIEMTRYFSDFLQSVAGLFCSSDRKARLKQVANKALDPEHFERIRADKEAFSEQVCALFDDFMAQGSTLNEAISRTNSALKAKNHPWAIYDLVKGTLRENGRFRKGRKTVK